MALTGIQIFKFLPAAKKEANANCKKCGCVTCMAYAMKLAKGEADVNDCPYILEDLKQTFEVENRKPQVKIVFGKNTKITIGDENVMFRHDKTFVNSCCFTIKLNSSDKNFDEKLNQISNFKISQIGKKYGIDAIALIDDANDFIEKVKIIFALDKPSVLVTENLNRLLTIEDLIKENKPIIYLKSQNQNELIEAAKLASIIVDGKTPEELYNKTENLIKAGVKNILLKLIQEVNSDIIEPLTMLRRSAIENKVEALGFPVMVSYQLQNNISVDTINLSTLVCKYCNLIMIDNFNPALLTSIITLRTNIYTDPQKPLQVEPKLYEIGDVNENSPVIVTTNFALTYFAVVNELEGLSKGTYLIITESGGMSVLTAWAASKFTSEIISKAIKLSGIKDKINHNNIIIPGLVSDLKEELESELPEFNIIVGTNEATDIPDFLKGII